MTRFMLTFVLVAAGLASAAPKTHHVTLNQTAWVGGNELKAGDYKVEIEGDKITLSSGKKVQVQVSAKVEANAKKYDSTSVVVNESGNRPTVQEIDLGGTTTKILFSGASKAE